MAKIPDDWNKQTFNLIRIQWQKSHFDKVKKKIGENAGKLAK